MASHVIGLGLMAVGLAVIGVMPRSMPLWLLAGPMVVVGLGGPTVSPPATADLLDAVPGHEAGVAKGTRRDRCDGTIHRPIDVLPLHLGGFDTTEGR